MMERMRIGSKIGRRLASAAIPLAFAAALPLVQWCPLGAAITFRDCLPGDGWPAAAAPASATATCGESSSCPAHDVACRDCPLQRSSPPTRCIGGPMGGIGLRPHAPQLLPPSLEIALNDAVAPEVEAPQDLGRLVTETDARPPTRSWARHAPVRGPPLG